jgi:hypothetical protein
MKTFKITHLVLPLIMALGVFSVSCAKKATGVRTIKQSEGKVMNAAVNTPSANAGSSQGLLYAISVIDRPSPDETDETTFVVTAEIRTPNGKYVPITTTHTQGQDVVGLYNDTDNGAQLDIRARCLKANCATYILLVTLIKNQHSVHQVLAISNSNEDYFHYENVNASVAAGYFYTSLDEVVRRKGLSN